MHCPYSADTHAPANAFTPEAEARRTLHLGALLLAVLLLAGLANCTSARKAAEQRRHRTEHAAPAYNPRGWYWDDERPD